MGKKILISIMSLIFVVTAVIAGLGIAFTVQNPETVQSWIKGEEISSDAGSDTPPEETLPEGISQEDVNKLTTIILSQNTDVLEEDEVAVIFFGAGSEWVYSAKIYKVGDTIQAPADDVVRGMLEDYAEKNSFELPENYDYSWNRDFDRKDFYTSAELSEIALDGSFQTLFFGIYVPGV